MAKMKEVCLISFEGCYANGETEWIPWLVADSMEDVKKRFTELGVTEFDEITNKIGDVELSFFSKNGTKYRATLINKI